jgi:hypothetical protein
MKILKQNQQVLIIQRGTKIGFLLGISFVMLALLAMILVFLYSISISLGLGGWGLLFLPLAVWLFWLGLYRFLTNDQIVTVYNFDKGRNQATIEFQGLRKSRTIDFPLDKIRSVEVKFLGAQYIGHGVTLMDFRLQLITNSGEMLVDKAVSLGEKRELESIARCLRGFILNY